MKEDLPGLPSRGGYNQPLHFERITAMSFLFVGILDLAMALFERSAISFLFEIKPEMDQPVFQKYILNDIGVCEENLLGNSILKIILSFANIV